MDHAGRIVHVETLEGRLEDGSIRLVNTDLIGKCREGHVFKNPVLFEVRPEMSSYGQIRVGNDSDGDTSPRHSRNDFCRIEDRHHLQAIGSPVECIGKGFPIPSVDPITKSREALLERPVRPIVPTRPPLGLKAIRKDRQDAPQEFLRDGEIPRFYDLLPRPASDLQAAGDADEEGVPEVEGDGTDRHDPDTGPLLEYWPDQARQTPSVTAAAATASATR